jgi:regulatory protein
MVRIQRLEPSKHVSGRILVWLEGEQDPIRVTEREVVSFSLYQGRELEPETLEALREEGARSGARARGARMLGERPLSKRELIKRLQDKGERPEDAQAAADALEELGVLDDLSYAQSIVRHYDSRGYGVARLRQELQRRGIPRELWEQAMEERSDSEDQILRFLEQKLHGELSDPKLLKRTTDALIRRGYRWEEIKTGLARYGAEIEEESL